MHASKAVREAGKPRARAPWLCLLALFAALGCTKFASELDQGDEANLALSALGPGDTDWSCLQGNTGAAASSAAAGASTAMATASATPPAGRASLTYSFSVMDFVTAEPVADVRVRACFRPDVNCQSPASEPLVPDTDGRLQLTEYAGFNGYLEITGAGMIPLLLFFPAPWSPELLAQLERTPVLLLPIPSLQALGDSARLPLDAASGVVSVYAYDCSGAAAAGVRLELDTGAVPYAFVDDLPVANRDVTSEQGLAGFVNVPPGVVVVSGFSRGQAEAMTVESLLVRSSWLSSVSLLPGFSR